MGNGSDSLKPFFFIHLPKCGGSSARVYFKKQQIGPWLRGAWYCNYASHILDIMASTVKIGGGHTNWYPGVPVRWMTMVRNPLKRFQSMLMFRKRRAPDMELYRGDINEFVKYRLADVEQYDFEWHRNMMTRMLGGDLDTARANLRKFALVGVTNRWLTFWNKAADMADVPRPQREYKTNCSSNYDAIRDMTPRTKQIIIDHNRDDFALYEEAVRLS